MINLNTLLIISTLLLTTSAASAAYTTKPKPPPRRTPTDGVTYTVTNRAASNTPGGSVFTNHIGTAAAQQAMSSATHFIWNLFNQTTSPTDRKPIKKITLFVENKGVSAYALENSIHVSASYIGNYTGNVKKEFTGVLYHVMAYTWMWDGEGTAPQGLKSGMAEFVRLKAHYAPRMVGMGPGRTDNWDEGYGVTAMFLDYCNNLKDGVFVAELNGKMKDGYSRGYFRELLGKSVDVLWQDYKSKYLLL
ncbi:hypothetical protein LINGRAHAP2_LOCUS35655 [Linum grandiflorum]